MGTDYEREKTPTTVFCPQCGYDLRGQTLERCPECGFHYDVPAIRTTAARDFSFVLQLYMDALPFLSMSVALAAFGRVGGWLAVALGLLLMPLVLRGWIRGNIREELPEPDVRDYFQFRLASVAVWLLSIPICVSEKGFAVVLLGVTALGVGWTVVAGHRQTLLNENHQDGMLSPAESQVLRRARTVTWTLAVLGTLGCIVRV